MGSNKPVDSPETEANDIKLEVIEENDADRSFDPFPPEDVQQHPPID